MSRQLRGSVGEDSPIRPVSEFNIKFQEVSPNKKRRGDKRSGEKSSQREEEENKIQKKKNKQARLP